MTDRELIEILENGIKDVERLLHESAIIGTPLESAKALAVLVEARALVKESMD